MSHIMKLKLFGFFQGSDFIKEDGSVVPAKPKLQLIEEIALKDGGVKSRLIDVSIPKEKLKLYESKVGTVVEVEVGIMSKTPITYYGI
jgi:hypothetical protein